MANTEVGSAYVSVYASTKDFQKQLDKAASGSAGKIERSFKSLGKKVVAGIGLAQIGSAVKGLFKGIYDSYSTFEQVSDGAMDVFDKINPDTIKADAVKAWSEMGMSANQYYEALTNVGAGFAASMGDKKAYAAAKEGFTALADYAAGSGKSIDLLTEKFQMISRSASGYQSIADQFSGVLPQTSAAFLEQAQKAGLLKDSYKKLTEVPVEEYQQALVGMLNKGNETMGWSGKQAAEASKTLTGSMEAIQTTWDNLLVSLGTGDKEQIQQAIADWTTAIGNFTDNVIPLIDAALPGIADGIKTLWDKYSPQILFWWDEHKEEIADKAAEVGMDVGEAFVNAIFEGIKTIYTNDDGSIDWDTVFATVANSQGAIGLGVNFGSKLGNTIAEGIKSLPTRVGSVLNDVKNTANEKFSAFVNVIKGKLDAAKNAVDGAINRIKSIVNGAYLSLPHFKLPHFNISGGQVPWGIGGKGTAPSISVDWYAKGSVFNAPSIIGVGEAGPEAVLPLNRKTYGAIADGIAGSSSSGNVFNITMNVSGAENPEAYARQLTSAIQRQVRMGVA